MNSYSLRSNDIILLKALSRKSFAAFHDNPLRAAIKRSEQKVGSETQSLTAPAVIEKLQALHLNLLTESLAVSDTDRK